MTQRPSSTRSTSGIPYTPTDSWHVSHCPSIAPSTCIPTAPCAASVSPPHPEPSKAPTEALLRIHISPHTNLQQQIVPSQCHGNWFQRSSPCPMFLHESANHSTMAAGQANVRGRRVCIQKGLTIVSPSEQYANQLITSVNPGKHDLGGRS